MRRGAEVDPNLPCEKLNYLVAFYVNASYNSGMPDVKKGDN